MTDCDLKEEGGFISLMWTGGLNRNLKNIDSDYLSGIGFGTGFENN
jgi:hypothetical protein